MERRKGSERRKKGKKEQHFCDHLAINFLL
jgi:hypothetical protein